MEFNLADPLQSTGLNVGSKKLQKEDADIESGSLLLFASIVEQVSQIKSKETPKKITAFPFPGKGDDLSSTKGEPSGFVKHNEKLTKGLLGNQVKSSDLKEGGKTTAKELIKGFLGNQLKSSGLMGAGKAETKGLTTDLLGNQVKSSDLKEGGKTKTNEFTGPNVKIFQAEKASSIPLADKITSFKAFSHNTHPEGTRVGEQNSIIGVSSKLVLGVESGSLNPERKSAVFEKGDSFKKNKTTTIGTGKFKSPFKSLINHSELKGELNIFNNEKTGAKAFADPDMTSLIKKMGSPIRLADRIYPVVGYQQAGIHTGGKMVAVNEVANQYNIEPKTLIHQIAKGVNGPGRIKIALTPPHLGNLDMDVVVRNNKVQIVLLTENSDVRQILQTNVETLKNALGSQGLIADTISVNIQEKSDNTGDSGFGRGETLLKEDNNQKENHAGQKGSQNSSDHAQLLLDEENPLVWVNGTISLFV